MLVRMLICRCLCRTLQWISLFCLLFYLVLMLMSILRTRLYPYELLLRINTPHTDKSFDHRHLLTDVNDFSAYMASRLNCGV